MMKFDVFKFVMNVKGNIAMKMSYLCGGINSPEQDIIGRDLWSKCLSKVYFKNFSFKFSLITVMMIIGTAMN